MQNQQQHKILRHNKIASFRRRRGLSQRQMASLLDNRSHAALWTYEQGAVVPSLESALKLEIILRTPVAFLFPSLYESLRNEIRAKEEKMAGYGQQDLFDHSPTRL
jgi:transcriptional regulator with XRE-family HTH domain